MPTLILLRHAKSDWSDGQDDRERTLAPRGLRGARAIGEFIARVAPPDIAITSPATRARETLRLAMEAGGLTCPARESERLYGGGVDALVDEVRELDDAHDVALVVGHEPTWSIAVGALTGGSDVRMPTAAAAAITFEGAWSQVGTNGLLLWLVKPRLLE